MIESTQPVLGAIEEEFQEDLRSTRFDHYVLLTWSVDEAYLKDIPADNTVVVCGPDSVGETVELLDRPNITWQHARSHAKCYLMWGDQELRCWLGSFNLTASGLRDNIEWAAVQEAPLDVPLDLEAVEKGDCNPAEITADGLLQQVLDIVMGVFTGSETTLATDYFNTPDGTGCVVLTNSALPGQNSLKAAVKTALTNATEDVTLTYYTPFVNPQGVKFLAGAIPKHIAAEDLNIELRTCRITEVDDQASYLNRRSIEELDALYGSFDCLARAHGTAGEEIPTDMKLRSGFVHFKLLLLTYTDEGGEDHTEVIFTSANLTANAWRPGADQLELGLWVRDPEANEPLSEFFGSRMRRCYSTLNEIDLNTIDRLTTAGDLIVERSLFELLADRVRIDDQGLKVDWGATDPPIVAIEADIHLRNLAGGDPRTESLCLVRDTDDGTFIGDLDPQQIDGRWAIHSVQLAVTTNCRPIEYALTDQGRDELVTPDSLRATIESLIAELETRGITYDEFVVNEEYTVEAGAEDLPSINTFSTIRVRRYFEGQPRQLLLRVEQDEQPHFPEVPLESVTATAITTDKLGGFCRITVTQAADLILEHDMIAFSTAAGESVKWLAYAPTETGINYYFESSVAGDTLTVTLQEPYIAYYEASNRQIKVTCPADISETAHQLRFVTSDSSCQFKHQPDLSSTPPEAHSQDAFITPGVPVYITTPTELSSLEDREGVQLAVEWKRRVGSYRAPTITPLTDPIVSEVAHSRFIYHGLITTTIEGVTAHFRTPENEFQVNQQVFATNAKADPRAASDVDLNTLRKNDHRGWLAYCSTDLLRPSVVLGRDRSIKLSVEIGDDAYDTCPQFRVYGDGQIFLIPLFGRHLFGKTTVTLRLSIANAPTTYGAVEIIRILDHKRTDTRLTRLVYDANGTKIYRQTINHDPENSLPRLDQYQSLIHSRDLESYLKVSDAFRIKRRTPTDLVIEALKSEVLHLGPYSPS